MFRKFDAFNHRISTWFEWIGLAALLVMMLVTCTDVIGAKLFKMPLLGALDIVMLLQIVAIAFSASMTLFLGRHINVEFFFDFLPRWTQRIVTSIVLLLGMALFSLIIWQLFELGRSFQGSGEYSPTAYIPLYPFAYAVALACIPVLLILLKQFIQSLTGSLPAIE